MPITELKLYLSKNTQVCNLDSLRILSNHLRNYLFLFRYAIICLQYYQSSVLSFINTWIAINTMDIELK